MHPAARKSGRRLQQTFPNLPSLPQQLLLLLLLLLMLLTVLRLPLRLPQFLLLQLPKLPPLGPRLLLLPPLLPQ
jgi:hypothetical protein